MADCRPPPASPQLQAARAIGCPPPIDAEALGALSDPAWQVREGGAHALGGADPDRAIPALLGMLGDRNLDVRRAEVRSLAGWTDRGEVVTALRTALTDTDADVRAYARRALAAVRVCTINLSGRMRSGRPDRCRVPAVRAELAGGCDDGGQLCAGEDVGSSRRTWGWE